MEIRDKPSESFSQLPILIQDNNHIIVEHILGRSLPILEAQVLYVAPSFTIIDPFISKNIVKS